MPLKKLCESLLTNSDDILLNPALGFEMTFLNNNVIPADCDLVVNDVVYDIKCTNSKKHIYEVFQLLGYAALLRCKTNNNRMINVISTINLLQGSMTLYDIKNISSDQMIDYLKILTNNY